jgi:insulysin
LKKSIPNKDEVNSTVSYFCAVGPAEDRQKHAVVTLLAGIIHEHLFKQLRTVEQLGYNVKSGVHVWTSTIGFYCGIQSVHNPSYCEERLEVFLDTMAKMLQDMSDDEFRSYKSPLIERLSANYQNLNEEQSSFWSQIQSGYNDFHQRIFLGLFPGMLADSGTIDTRDVEYLRHVTHEGLLEMFMERIHPDSIQRRKISVQIQSQQPLVDGPLANAGNVQERTIPATIIDNIQRFKAGLTLSKAATPV